MEAFRNEIDEEVRNIVGPGFRAEIVETTTVPAPDDPDLTYPNLDARTQRCKLLESCVLHVDIRDSTRISNQHTRETLVRLYSAFVRSMARCGGQYGGKVRNIVGDRVMVLFDRSNCFANAVNTAILMNSVGRYVLDQHFASNTIRLGIGIDYGKMLIAKAGIVRHGIETETSRSLVWLGQPANVASKLADEANKTRSWTTSSVSALYHYPAIDEWLWVTHDTDSFLDSLDKTHCPVLRHPDEYLDTYYRLAVSRSRTLPAILMTTAVFDGFRAADPSNSSLRQNLWHRQQLDVPGYEGSVIGGDVIFTAFKPRNRLSSN